MVIRPARADDAAGIRAVCAASLPFDPDAAELAGILSPGDLLVAENAGAVTGVAGGAVRPPSGGRRASGPVRGHVDLLAVAPPARGRGIGVRLLGAVEDRLRSGGATQVRLGQGGPVYLWPGVDPRYTAMACLADRAGYRRGGEEVNMAVDLDADALGTGPDERRWRPAASRSGALLPPRPGAWSSGSARVPGAS